MNLFEIAEANSTRLADRFDTLRASTSDDHRNQIDAFATRVSASARVGINMRPSVLTSILAANKHQNIYKWANEQSTLSGRSEDEILREKLGKYHARRLKFDDYFDNGRAFRYGALNIGGIGADKYGQFCIVLIAGFGVADKAIAYLKGDSLNAYLPSETHFHETELREDAALHSHCHMLAVLKHASALPTIKEDGWPNLVCSDTDYIEAVFVAGIELSCIDEVRMRDAEYRRLFDLAFGDYTKKHDDATNALIHDFLEILRAERDKIVGLERV